MAQDLIYAQYNIGLQQNAVVYSTPLTPVNAAQPQVNNPQFIYNSGYTSVISTPASQYFRVTFTSSVSQPFYTCGFGNVLVIPNDSNVQNYTNQVGFFTCTVAASFGTVPTTAIPLAVLQGGQQTPVSFNAGITCVVALCAGATTPWTGISGNATFALSVYCW